MCRGPRHLCVAGHDQREPTWIFDTDQPDTIMVEAPVVENTGSHPNARAVGATGTTNLRA